MNISKEIRIGVLVTAAIVIFFAGFYFLKGSNLFSGENEYFCYYNNVQGLQSSANVQIKGLKVGRVSSITLDGSRVKVVLSIDKKVKFPEGTVATLASADLLGTKIIDLALGKGPGIVADEATLPSTIEGGVMDQLSSSITPLLAKVSIVVTRLDTTFASVNSLLNEDMKQKLRHSIADLQTTMSNFVDVSQKLDDKSGELADVIHNANNITTNLSNNNEQITHILDNADGITAQLKNAPIETTFKNLQGTISQLQGILDKINNSQGSVGMMVNDKKLYENLTQTLGTLNTLVSDIQAHPSRYINVTIFGKKQKKQ